LDFRGEFAVNRVWFLALVALILGASCDMAERLTGTDPVTKVVRDNPVDPGASASLVFGMESGSTVVSTVRPTVSVPLSGTLKGYSLQVSKVGDFAGALADDENDITESSHALTTSLDNHATYFWRVRLRYLDGTESGWSAPQSFQVALPVPTPWFPTIQSVLTTPSPVLAWNSSVDSGTYEYQLSSQPDFQTDLQTEVVRGDSSPVTLDSARPEFYWRVRLVDHGVVGDWSPVANFSPPKGHFVSPAQGQFTSEPWTSGNVALGDLNGDGRPDLAVVEYLMKRFHLYYQGADGQFQSPVTVPTAVQVEDILIADVNGDGLADLVVCGYDEMDGPSGHVLVWPQDPSTHQLGSPMDLKTQLTAALSIASCDFNGDGRMDFAILGSKHDPQTQQYPAAIAVLLQTSSGTFGESDVLDPALTDSWTHGIQVADFNGDGRQDIVVPTGGTRNQLLIFHQSLTGTFTTSPTVVTFVDPQNYMGSFHFATGDLNGDGRSDILYSGGTWGCHPQISLQESNGSLQPPYTLSTVDSVFGELQIADMDGDGLNDIVVARNGILYQTPAHTFPDLVPTQIVSGTSGVVEGEKTIAMGDLDGDGKKDLAEMSFGLYCFNQVSPWGP
jgi:hypothetical protein